MFTRTEENYIVHLHIIVRVGACVYWWMLRYLEIVSKCIISCIHVLQFRRFSLLTFKLWWQNSLYICMICSVSQCLIIFFVPTTVCNCRCRYPVVNWIQSFHQVCAICMEQPFHFSLFCYLSLFFQQVPQNLSVWPCFLTLGLLHSVCLCWWLQTVPGLLIFGFMD